MSLISNFSTWDDVAAYIQDTMGITYTDDPKAWVDAMKDLTKGYKYVKVVNDVTGETTTQLMREDLVTGVGEFHVGENTSGSASASIGGGGVKSAPTAKSIITNSSGGGTAVITDDAIGVKDTGLTTGAKAVNVANGLLSIFGLINTGIKVANAQVWKDMSNFVFDSDFTEDTPVERVIEFMKMKVVNAITDLNSDGDLITTIPDSITQKMYAFLSNHMVQGEIPEITLSALYNMLGTYYNFHKRTIEVAYPERFTLERYLDTSNPTTTFLHAMIDSSDDLFKAAVTDAVEQNIGRGFNITSSVGTALLAAMDGVYNYIFNQSSGAVADCQLCEIFVRLNRGMTPPPKDTPVSLSEFTIYIYHRKYPTNMLNITENPETGQKLLQTNINAVPGGWGISLASGYSWQAGDCAKYLKRNKTGSAPTDYAYKTRPVVSNSSTEVTTYSTQVTFPSNEKSLYYGVTAVAAGTILYLNGYADDGDVYVEGPPDNGSLLKYSNLGYDGIGRNYEPDDYLVTAGIRSKTNPETGTPEKHPNPTKTMEEQYPELANKKQQANPQASKDSQTGQTVINNHITNYVPTAIPYGSENADRLINHGYNNLDDPQSYTDNRPQADRLAGKVNTNDPIDGYNEDTQSAIDQYNESREDPDHYPDPIPQSEPSPQYPVNPPQDNTGDTGDTPTPAGMTGTTASGMVSVYNPTKSEVVNFSAWLWTDNILENLKKILANPIDAIIGMHIMYATPVTGSPENIICGYLDSGVAAKVVTQQYIEVDCGRISIPEYYGTAMDYEPYTQIHIYLPFIGIQALKANDVIGKDLYVKYGVDVLTGTVLATLTTKLGTSEICCYQFAGNCAVQIPLTGGSYAEVIKGIASMAVGAAGSVVTGNPLPLIGGAVAGAMGSSLDVTRSGALGANAGVMGVRKPYLIITRRKVYEAATYSQFYGYPAHKTVRLSSCSGYTRVKSVHIDSISRATDSEKAEIETLLKQGVIIKA